jgi:hypothetical protein
MKRPRIIKLSAGSDPLSVKTSFAGCGKLTAGRYLVGISQNDSRRMATWISCPSRRPRFRKA